MARSSKHEAAALSRNRVRARDRNSLGRRYTTISVEFCRTGCTVARNGLGAAHLPRACCAQLHSGSADLHDLLCSHRSRALHAAPRHRVDGVAAERRHHYFGAVSDAVLYAGGRDLSALERLGDLAIGLALGFALEAGPEGAEASAEPDNAYARIELIQLRRRIAELVGNLPESERRVIVRHYFQQQPFEEIARGLSLTKGRISQIHHAALRRMRERLRELRNADVLG